MERGDGVLRELRQELEDPVKVVDGRASRHVDDELAATLFPRPFGLDDLEEELHLASLGTHHKHVGERRGCPSFLYLGLDGAVDCWLAGLGFNFDDNARWIPKSNADELRETVRHGCREETRPALLRKVAQQAGEGRGKSEVEEPGRRVGGLSIGVLPANVSKNPTCLPHQGREPRAP